MEIEISGWVCNMELVKIIDWIFKVWYYFNCFLEVYSFLDVIIGFWFFLLCFIDVDGLRVWFIDLWNYFIIFYFLEVVREGFQFYGRCVFWEDFVKWVMDIYLWVVSL